MGLLASVGKFLGGSAGGNIVSAIGAGLGFLGQERTNRMSAKEAQRNREFQERMSNTAVQRRMADMRAGGINPILAAKFDASTPAGAMANFGNPGAAAAQGFAQMGSTAVQLSKVEAEVEQIASRAALNDAQARAIAFIGELSGDAGSFFRAMSDWLQGSGENPLRRVGEQVGRDVHTAVSRIEELIRKGQARTQDEVNELTQKLERYIENIQGFFVPWNNQEN